VAVVACVTSGQLLVADDQQPASADGYKTVNVGGDKGMPVRVQEDRDPLANVASHDTSSKYDPERIFSQSSSMANKSFSGSSDIANTGHNDYNKSSSENTFVTKPYSFDSKTSSVAGLNNTATFPTTPLSNRTSTDFGKSFNTASADLGPTPTSSFSSKAREQDRTAVLGGHTVDTPTSPLGAKVFYGDEADSAKKRLTRLKSGQMYVQDLPNRPLTIDEVRELINHGFKPDTDKAADLDDSSKPLNDPNYVPKPIRETPEMTAPASPASDEDKDDPVPPPGTMSAQPAPENSQPLPQR
jgi:hypothetical protein